MRKQSGFTLIEVMIVIAIVAILVAVGYPAYTEHSARGKISEATSTLAETRTRLEQFYQDNGNYGSTNNSCPNTPTGRYFDFTCRWRVAGDPHAPTAPHTASDGDGTVQTYFLTATGKSGEGMSGYTFAIDHQGSRVTTAFPGASGLPKPCWISKKGDSC